MPHISVMGIFAVIASADAPGLGEAIQHAFPDRWYEVTPTQFFVVEPQATTPQISEKLDIPSGHHGRVMVLRVANWNGWHSRNMWEWLAAQSKAEAAGGSGEGG